LGGPMAERSEGKVTKTPTGRTSQQAPPLRHPNEQLEVLHVELPDPVVKSLILLVLLVHRNLRRCNFARQRINVRANPTGFLPAGLNTRVTFVPALQGHVEPTQSDQFRDYSVQTAPIYKVAFVVLAHS